MSRFDYVKYDPHARIQQAGLKSEFESLEQQIVALQDGRAKSLALTALEESYMWVGKRFETTRLPAMAPQTPGRPRQRITFKAR